MPSIPQSLLWIALVVLWLFVLVPMLINKRDTVRRTSDVALSTRVLNGGVKSRLLKRRGPAAGHRHDAAWAPDDEFAEDYPDIDDTISEVGDYADQREVIREYDDAVREARMGTRVRSMVVVAAVTEQRVRDLDYLDVDVVEESSGALPIGETGVQSGLFDSFDDEPEFIEPSEDSQDELTAEPAREEPRAAGPRSDEYELIEDTSGLEFDELPEAPVAPRSASRERRLSTTAEAAVSARKYRFRKRVLMVMAALMLLGAVLSVAVSSALWWSCGAVAGITVLYLAYLRRQTRIEAQVRRRRQQRMARSRPVFQEESAPQRPEVDFTEFPTRLQRPGAVVLEIDDEDPAFEHLDEVPYSRRHYGRSRDLPRASGQ